MGSSPDARLTGPFVPSPQSRTPQLTMRRRRSMSGIRKLVGVGIACAVVTGGGTVLAATASDSTTTVIHACVSRGVLGVGTGDVRIVDGTGQCRSTEYP